jgi:4-hydroxythreonine-4-phosphate dehydrogenase
MSDRLPRVAVTLGDPAGIGPEVVAKALSDPRIARACRPTVYGASWVLDAAMGLVRPPQGRGWRRDDGQARGPGEPAFDVVDIPGLPKEGFRPGQIDAACGRASFAYLRQAAQDALCGHVDALATAPLHKEATALAGFSDIGHLEYLTRLTGALETATALVAGHLRCLHLTTHLPLADAVRAVTRERVLARLRLAHREMGRFGVARPRIAVAALNPHGGERGLFGREEMDEIAPAVADAVAEGIDAHGPIPADSLLAMATAGGWDLALVLYHDQGHIAVKVHDFYHSYTVAFGLPLVRTSVDHGTAFDVAWQGKADARSMVAAILAAAALARGRWPSPAEVASDCAEVAPDHAEVAPDHADVAGAAGGEGPGPDGKGPQPGGKEPGPR